MINPTMDLLEHWNKIQQPLRDEIGPAPYDTWFGSLRAVEQNGALSILSPDDFYRAWIEEHYGSLIRQQINRSAGQELAVTFDVGTPVTTAPATTATARPYPDEKEGAPLKNAHLNPKFLFEHFVVGPSNRFAFAAAQAVAEQPAKAYNPLFIYGPVGLGKTHLMQAITQEIGIKQPHLKICYISSEQFTNELINAIRHRSADAFRQKYRHVDVLLIDDIHFIAGKESTQEEFFHTFNVLHDHRKQIIICSDRPPKEIANLEERLVSRFAWGLITDIQPPDYETRVAILKKKTELESVSVPDDVLNFIAAEIKTNIRELEGALIRVVACALLEDRPITLPMAKSVLKDMVKETVKIVSVDMVQKEVAAYFNIAVADLKTKKRHKNIVLPRQVSMYLSRKLTTHSLPEIGAAFGGKDHTTILHAFKKIDGELQLNKETKKIVDDLTFILMA